MSEAMEVVRMTQLKGPFDSIVRSTVPVTEIPSADGCTYPVLRPIFPTPSAVTPIDVRPSLGQGTAGPLPPTDSEPSFIQYNR